MLPWFQHLSSFLGVAATRNLKHSIRCGSGCRGVTNSGCTLFSVTGSSIGSFLVGCLGRHLYCAQKEFDRLRTLQKDRFCCHRFPYSTSANPDKKKTCLRTALQSQGLQVTRGPREEETWTSMCSLPSQIQSR